MDQNPFSLVFGKEPSQLISRGQQVREIVDMFRGEQPAQQVYMITGVRGAGKTVFMSEVAKELTKQEQWILVGLNPERNLLEDLMSKLCSVGKLAQFFQRAEIDLSFFGLGLKVKGGVPISNAEFAVERMLECLDRQDKRLLIMIDEVSNSKEMREFSASYQMLVRKDLPVYLLMTGLYENINSLQNEKSLTFLYRVPRIELKPLNLGIIAGRYESIFSLDRDEALRMARMTCGYSFAFQVLGYYAWENREDKQKVRECFKQYLEEYVYDKIWSELSAKDRFVLYGIAASKSGRFEAVREILHLTGNELNPYRRRLIRKGLINGDERSVMRFTLPLFDEFVLENYIVEE